MRGQWVAWKAEPRKGQLTKPPINPQTGKHAKVSDPTTWGTFDEALKRMKDDNLDGVGYVLTSNDDITAIDLDHCLNPQTGALDPMAERIVKRFDSYTEVSPSGEGLHIFVLGQLPPNAKNRDGNIEMYDSDRYITVSGNRLTSTSPNVKRRQAEVDALTSWMDKDAALVEGIKATEPGFAQLWNGDTSKYENDHSKADFALCSDLTMVTQDADQIDRIFRWSGLMREKWDECHRTDGRTYGQMTIDAARANIARKTAHHQQSSKPSTKLEIVRASDLYDKNMPPTKWFVNDVLHEGACLFYGDPKVGKSFLALEIAIAVAGGQKTVLGGLEVGQQGRVLYLALDDSSEKRFQKRLRALTNDQTAIQNIDIVIQRGLPTLKNGLIDILNEHLSQNSYELVILDTLGAVSDTPSNRNVYGAEYQEAVALSALAKKHGICLVIVHHSNKRAEGDTNARSSGSNGRTGGVDSILRLSSDGKLEVRPRDGESRDIQLDRQENGGWAVRSNSTAQQPSDLNEPREEVRRVLEGGPKTVDDVATALGLRREAARKRLERMEKDALVKKLPDKRYELVTPEPAGGVCPVQVSNEEVPPAA